MLGVGARQGDQHSGCRPTGDPTGSNELDPVLMEEIEELKAPGHPTGIFSKKSGQPGLGEIGALEDLAKQPRLLEGLPFSIP